MKVLVSSIACLPGSGSEGIYGWRACRAIAKDHKIWVLTSADNQERLEQQNREGGIPMSMRIEYLGKARPPHPNRMIARLDNWQRYRQFAANSLMVAQRLHAAEKFDLVHLVTYTTWRVACPLWRLGIPFVFGPISGTEEFPWRLWRTLSPSALAFEVFRKVSGWWSWWSPEVRASVRAASVIPVTHSQAGRVLAKLRRSAQGIVPFVNVFFAAEDIERLRRPPDQSPPARDEPLRIFGSGNCEGRKGVSIALEALKILKGRGVPFRYLFSNPGPETGYLRKQAKKLGLSGEVTLGQFLPRADFLHHLQTTEVYLLPSLREGAGQTMMEAMLASCVPLVVDLYGPAEIVTEDCGWKIPVTDRLAMAQAFADRLQWCFQNRYTLSTMGERAKNRIMELFTEDAYRRRTQECYRDALVAWANRNNKNSKKGA